MADTDSLVLFGSPDNDQPASPVIEMPAGVELSDFDDYARKRDRIFSSVKNSIHDTLNGASYNGVTLRVRDLAYKDEKPFNKAQQKEALLRDDFLGRDLRGTVELIDEATGEVLDTRKNKSLLRVPYLTDRGTFIHGGNEWVSSMQSRLLPGAYTRRQNNGGLETQFNVRRGSGPAFRVAFDPKSSQYYLRMSNSDMHLYSMLHDIGVDDESLKTAWGEEVFQSNKDKYDRRVFEKAFTRLARPAVWQTTDNLGREGKSKVIKDILNGVQINKAVTKSTLPELVNLFEKRAAVSGSLRVADLDAVIAFLNTYFTANIPTNTDKSSKKTAVDAFITNAGYSSLSDLLNNLLNAQIPATGSAAQNDEAAVAFLAQLGYTPAMQNIQYNPTNPGAAGVPKMAAQDELMELLNADELDTVSGFETPGGGTNTVTGVPGKKPYELRRPTLSDDGEEYIPVGVEGLIAATKKLRSVSRGEAETDHRDSFRYKKIFTTPDLIAERIQLDAGKVRKTLLQRAAKMRNLNSLSSGHFTPYTEGQLLQNRLSAPFEQINMLQNLEQNRRITQMGDGGLSSSRSITEDAQALDTSTFGFLGALEGPECFDNKSLIFTKDGWKYGKDLTLSDLVACDIDGKMEFHHPSRVIAEPYQGDMLMIRSINLNLCVTPSHRIIFKRDNSENKPTHVDYAGELFGQSIWLPMNTLVYDGKSDWKDIQIGPHTFAIEDWCAFVGWYLSEGSLESHSNGKILCLEITQVEDSNKRKFETIRSLFDRMGLKYSFRSDDKTRYCGFRISDADIIDYFSRRDCGCAFHGIPEDLFDAPATARQAMLDALLLGDGRINKTHKSYVTISDQLCHDVERLMISLGYSTSRRIEKDRCANVESTNHVVSILKTKRRGAYPYATYKSHWSTLQYDDMVYCVSVPGSRILVKREKGCPVWTGNSEMVGLDTRVAFGAKLGSDGRLYQPVRNTKTGRIAYMNAEQMASHVIGFPD